ncbi:MAG: anhydro-N-acetylmuramic acid kinase [Planctomycetota bacterium]
MKRIVALQEKREKLVLGLLSGTSADGIDAALVRVHGHGLDTKTEVLGFRTQPFPDVHRERILTLGDANAETICRYNFILGELFASAGLALLEEAGVAREAVDLVGSHGQTVVHVPRGSHEKGATLQIGEGDVIAERLGVPVVSDFRTRDVAAGGEGAPLAAYVDFLLFQRAGPPRLTLNLGGIANLTLVSHVVEDVFAFDTGPANMPMDEAVRLLTDGKEHFDRDGKRAAEGRVDENLLAKLSTHPYLALAPPKTTGREMFGKPFVLPLLRGKGASTAHDVIATLTAFSAHSVARAVKEFVLPRHRPTEVLVSGGGVHNPVLMSHLSRLLPMMAVRTLDAVGLDPDAKEALLFAVLANETIHGNPNNHPGATGAQWPVVLGKISP